MDHAFTNSKVGSDGAPQAPLRARSALQSWSLRALAAAPLLALVAQSCIGPAESRARQRSSANGAGLNQPALPQWSLEKGVSDGTATVAFDELVALGTVSLDQILTYALQENAGIEVARERALAKGQAALAAGAMPEPRVSWAEFMDKVETKVGPQERRFELSQTLPWFGSLEADIEGAEARARAASSNIQIVERDLLGRIESLLWRRQKGARAAELELHRVSLFRSISAAIEARYRTGNSEYADLLRSRSEIERALELRDRALDNVERSNVFLRRELGLGLGAKLPTVLLVEAPPGGLNYTSAGIDAGLLDNPKLMRIGHLADAATKGLERVDFERKPDFTVGAFLIQTGQADNPATPGSGRDATGLKLSLTLPIRQGRYDAMELGARHEIRALRMEREDAMLALEGQVAIALEDLRAAERRRDLIAESLLPRAKQVLDTTRAGYSSGRATYLDLVNAGNSLIGLELELLEANVERELARIVIEVQLGSRSTPISTPTATASAGPSS
jgi:cobalt-zinc-cadmium efflux system outer membrane protein